MSSLLLLCSPPYPLCPFAPPACRPPLHALLPGLVSSGQPRDRAGHPLTIFTSERKCPGRGAAGRRRLRPPGLLSQVGALARGSPRPAAAPSLARSAALGRQRDPRRPRKGRTCLLCVPSGSCSGARCRGLLCRAGIGPEQGTVAFSLAACARVYTASWLREKLHFLRSPSPRFGPLQARAAG